MKKNCFNLSICFMLAFFIACSDSRGSDKATSSNIPDDNTIISEPDVTDPAATEDEITEDDDIPILEDEEITKMNTLLYYDGSLKKYDGIAVTKLFDCDSIVKADNYYFTDFEVLDSDFKKLYDIPEKAIKATVYDDKIFYYTENNNLYYIDIATGGKYALRFRCEEDHDDGSATL